MLRFNQFIAEVDLNDIKKDETGSHATLHGHPVPDSFKHVGNIKGGHKVYLHNGVVVNKYVVADKNNKVHTALNTKRYTSNENHEEIQYASTSKGSPGIHHLYHHLVTKHDKILSSDSQSEGARKVWHKVSKMKGIHVHGFDTKNNKAIHLNPHEDDEYHSKDDEHKAGLDSIDHKVGSKEWKKHQQNISDIHHSRKHVIAVMHKKD